MSTATYLAYDFPLLSMFWTMLWFFLWIMWFILLFRIIVDIFRDDQLSGWGKAGWLLFVILLPFLGVLVYVIARGKNMGHREIAQARAQQEAFDSYIRDTAGGRASSADELTKLARLKESGAITEEEFQRAKAQILSGSGTAGTRKEPQSAGAAGH